MDLASREVSDAALKCGDIDIKPEYLGSELLMLDPDAEASGDPAAEAALLAPLLKERSWACCSTTRPRTTRTPSW